MLPVILSCIAAGPDPRASQPLANFFPCPKPRLQGFSLKKMGWEKPWGRSCPGPCNNPRSLCKSSLVPVSFLLSGECFLIQLMKKIVFVYFYHLRLASLCSLYLTASRCGNITRFVNRFIFGLQ